MEKDAGRRDGTEYAIGDWEGDEFMPHYTQLLSVAVIRANAQRGIKKTRALRQRSQSSGTALRWFSRR